MRLIDADDANVDRICCYYGGSCYLEDVQEWLDDQPTIDAELVRHGEWVEKDGKPYCTAHKGYVTPDVYGSAYCPVCGAWMDAKEEMR